MNGCYSRIVTEKDTMLERVDNTSPGFYRWSKNNNAGIYFVYNVDMFDEYSYRAMVYMPDNFPWQKEWPQDLDDRLVLL